MSSTTGLIFSYALGIIFAVGGVVFLLFRDEQRFLFGVPYLLMGLALIYGVRRSQRRRTAGPADGPDTEDDGQAPHA